MAWLLWGRRIEYLLRATFNAANQGYANTQVLDTAVEGVSVGQLTVIEVDGTIAIVSNRCHLTAQGTPVFTDLGLIGEIDGGGAFTKSLGLGLLAIVNLSTWEEMGLGWHSAAAVVDPDNMKFALQATSTDGEVSVEGGTVVYTGLSLNTDYRFVLICGGYDVNEVPWRSGEIAANYLYGAALFIKVGLDYNLVWRKIADNTAPLYGVLSSLDAVGDVDDIVVPDVDLSAVLQPNNLSTFTAINGTSLDAIAPEVGGVWTEDLGNFDIQGNEASVVALGAVPIVGAVATVDSGLSDVIVDSVVNCGTQSAGLIGRLSDNDHFWMLYLDNPGNQIVIYERNAGWTARGNAAVAIADNTDYDARMIFDGQIIDGFLDGGNKASYGLAAFNETETKHGIYADGGTSPNMDNFAVYPRTSPVYDAQLGGV